MIKYNKIDISKLFFLLILFIVLLLEFQFTSFNIEFTNFLTYQLFCIYFAIYIYAINKYGFLHIYPILLTTSFLFWLGRLFIGIFDPEVDFRQLSTLIEINIPEQIAQKSILIYTIFIVVVDITLNLLVKKIDPIKEIKLTHSPRLEYIGRTIIHLFLVFAIIRVSLEVKLLMGNRLLLFQEGSTADLGVPLYLRLTSLIFSIGYLIFIASFPTKKKFVIYSIIYFLSIIPMTLIGNRMMVAIMILYILWYMVRVYGHKFKISKVAVWAIIMMIAFQFIAFFRDDSIDNQVPIYLILVMFITSQSMTFYILPLLIQYRTLLNTHPYPFVFDSMLSGLTATPGQNVEALSSRSSLGHHLVHTLNPSYYFSGRSLGTSYIAEVYEFGLPSLVFGAIFLAYYIYIFNKYIVRNRFFMTFSMLFFAAIVTSPRASLLPSLYTLGRNILFISLILIVFDLLKIAKDKIIQNRLNKKHNNNSI